ncbi:translation initiation factor IF-2 [Methylobacterium oryzae]|uniref:Translation initiation factor IF-2 n=1 Tax=Methylobacterium oryzae TaxID=334852 RepID=A0ABU7TI10_9HYPH
MPAVTLSSSPAVVDSTPRPDFRPSLLGTWLRRIRTRRALAALHPDQARDAGLEPWELRAEIGKPFWRA